MLAIAVGIEVAYAAAQNMNGFSVSFFEKYGSPQFFSVRASLTHSLHWHLTSSSPVLPPRLSRLAFGSLCPHNQP